MWNSARVNTLGMKFAEIEPGTFTMGPDVHRVFDRQPAHRVIISQGYFLSITEVTNEQMQRVLSDYVPNSFSPESDGPAVGIKWEMALQFCERLSELEQSVYRLPTEAEWEYACRAGTTTLFSFGDSKRELAEYGWYRNESGGRAARVAMLKPNAWGLFDMHGNAAEWVSDWYTHSYYSKLERAGEVRDPKGPARGWSHVLRSGGWPAREPLSCSSAARMPFPLLGGFSARKNTPPLAAVVGFRIVRERELIGEF
ncbi:MAG: formylglycine-generating enzyme family protein [Planctomycetota bacterium]